MSTFIESVAFKYRKDSIGHESIFIELPCSAEGSFVSDRAHCTRRDGYSGERKGVSRRCTGMRFNSDLSKQ